LSSKRILSNGYSHDYRIDRDKRLKELERERDVAWEELKALAAKQTKPQDEIVIICGPKYLDIMNKAFKEYLEKL
jgi:hypothetical protein